ncbi:MAG: hypothetical protein M1817_004650 [Caeruleum heppii]|nr:MAG: hypothetical protein M1817_004650 [Caeruleum heppii]
MRPPRLLIVLSSFVALPVLITLLSLLKSQDATSRPAASSDGRKSGLTALFSFHSPSSLFPPSAIISLTDDNSTFFLARPAAFGPSLPLKGLSGQLWIGSGFGDDTIRRGGGASLGAEGELGCSDAPGWEDGKHRPKHYPSVEVSQSATEGGKGLTGSKGEADSKGGPQKRATSHDTFGSETNPEKFRAAGIPSKDDGTDDYLHHTIMPGYIEGGLGKESTVSQAPHGSKKDPPHADIESLQEGAEISGKVVLLSRGGCGFLEKVKWTQRRGGVALIVGDNTRGGGLVTMYAQGDTSNITIPSLFTAHTTAHLLSSLIPSGELMEDAAAGISRVPPAGNKVSRPSQGNRKTGSRKAGAKQRTSLKDRPTFTPTMGAQDSTATPRPIRRAGKVPERQRNVVDSPFLVKERPSWFRCALATIGIGHTRTTPNGFGGESRRPPSSGQLGWVAADKGTLNAADDRDGFGTRTQSKPSTALSPMEHSRSTVVASERGSGEFVIGVQDWRDPDLLNFGSPNDKSDKVGELNVAHGKGTEIQIGSTSKGSLSSSSHKTTGGSPSDETDRLPFEGGSITPGSGEYGQSSTSSHKPSPVSHKDKHSHLAAVDGHPSTGVSPIGWLTRLWRTSGAKSPLGESDDVNTLAASLEADALEEMTELSEDGDLMDEEEFLIEDLHDGLWLTLTPTSMSTSPFFDTLLVLVVSPLVTLTVVYGMLLLRSRIRRRRWRAPKSVVERLPVRTYYTIPSSTPSSSSQWSTSETSSPTSPLLQTRSSMTPPPRPRSQTASSVLTQGEVPRSRPVSVHTRNPTINQEISKSASPVWRRRYKGKQVECVVCLEEYVDGLSRVMSLPCGHEFHVDCITPWLTTRRRTCPICKGDVVRSLAQGSSSNSDNLRSSEASDEDVQEQAAESSNDSATAALPMPPRFLDTDNQDLERGPGQGSDAGVDGAEAQSWNNGNPPRFGSLRGFAASFGGPFSGATTRGRPSEARN